MKDKKTSILLLIFVAMVMVLTRDAHALWPDSGRESKLEKDSYEKLVAKNLELRNEVDTLTKEQEQVRGIYKVLLEKVKVLQNDNAEANHTIESVKKELADAKKNTVATLEPVKEAAPAPEVKDLEKNIEDMKQDAARQEEEAGRIKAELSTALKDQEVLKQQLDAAREAMQKKNEVAAPGSDKDERIKMLEGELDKLDSGLKSADDTLKMRDEDIKALEALLDKDAIKKRYPEAFAESKQLEKYKKSGPVESVRDTVDGLTAKEKVKREKAAGMDREIEKLRADGKEAQDKLESYDNRIAELKSLIADINTEIKTENNRAGADQDRIKGLESSLERAVAEKQDYEARLQESGKKISQITESIRKAGFNATKGSSAASKGEDTKLLEKELDKMNADEKDLTEKTREAGKKTEDLKAAINEGRARSKDNAARAASGKQKIAGFEKEISVSEAGKNELKKTLQDIAKKTKAIEKKHSAIMADITKDDLKIGDLKKIVEKNSAEIELSEGSQIPPDSTLAERADIMLSTMNDKIKKLEDDNKRLQGAIQSAGAAEKSAKRETASEKILPDEIKRKMEKERLNMHFNLAVVYDKNKMYRDAEREYLKCLKIDPLDADVHYNLGILYDDKLNNNHKASQEYKKFLELRPMGENATQVRTWLTRIELEDRIGKEAR